LMAKRLSFIFNNLRVNNVENTQDLAHLLTK
jgi:hypothetical protein